MDAAAKRFEVPSDYANILVQCPIPGKTDQPAQTLNEFMQTETGQRVGADAIANAEMLADQGIDRMQAIAMTLGPAAMKDPETGNVILKEPVPDVEQVILDPAKDPKKKLNPPTL